MTNDYVMREDTHCSASARSAFVVKKYIIIIFLNLFFRNDRYIIPWLGSGIAF